MAGRPSQPFSENEDEARIAALRAALDEGLASGVHKGDDFAEIRAELHSTGSQP